jgi:hypothetical protein
MPKISPRNEVTSHPLYQSAMAAQHIAYQLMREVPADRKADAARLHAACVHVTSHLVYAIDPDSRSREVSFRGALEYSRDAKERVPALAGFATDSRDTDALVERLAEIEKAASEALGTEAVR